MGKVLFSMLALVILAFTGLPGLASDSYGQVLSGTQMSATGAGAGMVLTRPDHEGGKEREVIGTVVSIDQEKNEIVVKDDYSQVDTPVRLHDEDMPKVKVGDEVKAILTHHTNVARTILHVEQKSMDPNKQ